MGKAAVIVLMPIYGPSPDMLDAFPMTIRSVLWQSFGDFEFLILDRSTNERVRSRFDQRERLHDNPHLGVPGTLNRGVALAHGEYGARQAGFLLALHLEMGAF